MTTYQAQVQAVVRATRFLPSSRILWFGESAGPTIPRQFRQTLTPATLREQMLLILQNRLYRSFYTKGVPWPAAFEPEFAGICAPPGFAQGLDEANCGAGYLQPAWKIHHLDDVTLVASRNGLEITLSPAHCRIDAGNLLRPGASVGVQFPKGLFERSPGFYLALGNKLSGDDESTVVRVYWNITSRGAVRLMELVTRALNDAYIPFQFKVLNDPARFNRCDAAVLYLSKADYPVVRLILRRIYAEIGNDLKPQVPGFTKRLAPGMGLAEDPGPGVSFGEDRCNLLADALMSAHERGKIGMEDRFTAVVARFQEHGVSLETPYVNRGSSDVYDIDIAPSMRPVVRSVQRVRRPGVGDYVETAQVLGYQICQQAMWSEDRCNWTGATTDDAAKVTHGALGPDLYGGTSGVALFLAELHAATGDVVARSTALGAMRQALARTASIAPGNRLGVFTGLTGIALASARVGILTGEDEFIAAAGEVLRLAEYGDPMAMEFDVISGAAGAITALLGVGGLLDDMSLSEAAKGLGDALIERADKRNNRWSWRAANPSGGMNLTGFSHGTAGVASALLEVFRMTGDVRYVAAADLAFEYERHWYDAEARNWPDFRGYPSRSVRRGDALPCSAFWCHGAPGIALSRLRAHEITGDARRRAEALVALETTRVVTERSLDADTMNFSLCHGLAGNAEILLFGATALGEDAVGASRVATDVAAAGMERHRDRKRAWPCGAGGQTPGLMAGLAGIGLFYLRLSDGAIPSILVLDPRTLASKRPARSASLVAMPS